MIEYIQMKIERSPGSVTVRISEEDVMYLKDMAISAAAHRLTAVGLGDVELHTVSTKDGDYVLEYEEEIN